MKNFMNGAVKRILNLGEGLQYLHSEYVGFFSVLSKNAEIKIN
jgi:hypothetical protein